MFSDVLKKKYFLEDVLIWGALLFFVALQLNAISKGNFAGQDYQRHCENIRLASEHPLTTFLRPVMDGTGMVSLYHVAGGSIYRIFGEKGSWRIIACLNLLANVLAFLLIGRLLRKIFFSSVMRIAAFIFILFLPLTVITTVVVAADAATVWLFVVMVWLLVVLCERLQQGRKVTGILILQAFVLMVAFLNKLHYGICVFGTLAVVLFLWRYGLLYGKKLISALLIVFVIPLIFMIMAQGIYTQPKMAVLGDPQDVPEWSRMDPRRLFFLTPHDPEVLAAPSFHEEEFVLYKIQPKAQTPNYFSYPALLHLGIYTDFLNIYQPIVYASNDPRVKDEYYTRIRLPDNRQRMSFAVKSALLFSGMALFSVIFWVILSLRNLWRRENLSDIPAMIMLSLGLPVFLGMALILPFTRWTYQQGVYLPRFILPALIFFFIMVFLAFERMLVIRYSWMRWMILMVVILQSLLHISFLWVQPETIQVLHA
jgi:hypothetical protein